MNLQILVAPRRLSWVMFGGEASLVFASILGSCGFSTRYVKLVMFKRLQRATALCSFERPTSLLGLYVGDIISVLGDVFRSGGNSLCARLLDGERKCALLMSRSMVLYVLANLFSIIIKLFQGRIASNGGVVLMPTLTW